MTAQLTEWIAAHGLGDYVAVLAILALAAWALRRTLTRRAV